MKRCFLFYMTIILSSLECFPQIKENHNVNFQYCIDNYICNLIKLNYSNILQFDQPYDNNQIKYYNDLIEKILPDIKISNMQNLPFHIRKDCSSISIGANVFFITYSGTIKKIGDGEIVPNQVTMTYRWKALSENILFFIFTNRELNNSLQEYVFIPCRHD